MMISPSLCLATFVVGLLLVVSVKAVNDPVVCPTIGATKVGSIDTRDPFQNFGEISGISLSPTQLAPSGEPLLFAASDGDSGERIGMWDPQTGERLRTLKIRNTTVINRDWEAMAIGSCGITGPTDSCIYIMDAGDNPARGNVGRLTGRRGIPYNIVKIREPKLEDFNDQDWIPESYISVVEYDYEDPSFPTKYSDSELMFMDHVGWGPDENIGDIWIVTKWDGRRNAMWELTRLFRIPIDAWPDTYCGAKSFYRPKAVGNYEYTTNAAGVVTGGQIMGTEWRSGEMTYDGTVIGLGDVAQASLFLRCPGESVVDTLAGPNATTRSCRSWPHPAGGQVEAFCWSPDGTRSLDIPEGHRPRIGWTNMNYNHADTSRDASCSRALPAVPQLTLPSNETLEECATTSPTITAMPVSTGSPSSSPAPTFEGQTYEPTQGATDTPTEMPSQPTTEPTVAVTDSPIIATTSPTATTNVTGTAQTGSPTEARKTVAPTNTPATSKACSLRALEALLIVAFALMLTIV